MKKYLIPLLLTFVAITLPQPTCLLDEPLKDQCIQSIDLSMVELELTKYLCTISYERKLYQKAMEFCKQASTIDYLSGYLYFSTLLVKGLYQSALKTQYMLFFTNPFQHNAQLNESLSLLMQEFILFPQMRSYNHDDNFSLSIYHFYQNQTEKSLTHLKHFLTQNKQRKDMVYEHFLMMRILQKQYKYFQALQYITMVIKTNKVVHPYFYHLKGNFLMHHIQFQKAIRQFQSSNKQFHNIYKSNGFSFSHYNIGLCFQKLGNIEEAIRYYQASVVSVNSAQALNALGHAYYTKFEKNGERKMMETAEKYYKKSLQVNPQYMIAIFNLGMLQLQSNQLNKAAEYFIKCSSVMISCKYGLLKTYYKLNSTQQVSMIIESIQKNDESITQLAAILYQMGDYLQALDIIGKEKQYKSSQLYEWKGFNEYSLQKYQSAKKSFQQAIFLGSKKAYIYYSLGLSQIQLKEYGQCAHSFGQAYKLQPRKQTKENLQKCKKMITDL